MSSRLIDMHCHILPGIDDGSPNLETSVQMAREYGDRGFDTVTATPHHIVGSAWSASVEKILHLKTNLQKTLNEKNIPITIKTGMEIAYCNQFWKNLERKEYLALGDSNTYLVEFPFQQEGQRLVKDFLAHQTQKISYTFLIAHPERYSYFQEFPDQVEDLISQGCMIQLNIGSVLGLNGPKCQRTSYHFLKNRWCHIISTDSHGIKRRAIPSQEKLNQLCLAIGSENFASSFSTNPSRLLQNEQIDPLLAADLCLDKIIDTAPPKNARPPQSKSLLKRIFNLIK